MCFPGTLLGFSLFLFLLSLNVPFTIATPNVLFISIDDLRDTLGYMGHHDALTPNIDQLASRGAIFHNAHCQSTNCGPSRSSMMTGTRPHVSGIYGFADHRLSEEIKSVPTLFEHFKSNGFYTMGMGKLYHMNRWNYDTELTRGSIDEGKGFKSGTGSSKWLDTPYMGPSTRPIEAFDDHDIATRAIAELSKNQSAFDNKPFFLGVGIRKPHDPQICPQEFFDLYNASSLTRPDIVPGDMDDIPMAARYISDLEWYHRVTYNKTHWDRFYLSYLAQTSFVDYTIGKIMTALNNSVFANNTIVAVWSDHGFHLGEKEAIHKRTLWQEVTRVPMLLSGPGVLPNVSYYTPVEIIDMYRTLAELTGIPQPPASVSGRSLVNLINVTDAEETWPLQPALTTFGRDTHALTFKRWKYIRYFDGSDELYDLRNDPDCIHNKAHVARWDEKKRELQAYLPVIPGAPNICCDYDNGGGSFWNVDYPDLNGYAEHHDMLVAYFNEKGKPYKANKKYKPYRSFQKKNYHCDLDRCASRSISLSPSRSVSPGTSKSSSVSPSSTFSRGASQSTSHSASRTSSISQTSTVTPSPSWSASRSRGAVAVVMVRVSDKAIRDPEGFRTRLVNDINEHLGGRHDTGKLAGSAIHVVRLDDIQGIAQVILDMITAQERDVDIELALFEVLEKEQSRVKLHGYLLTNHPEPVMAVDGNTNWRKCADGRLTNEDSCEGLSGAQEAVIVSSLTLNALLLTGCGVIGMFLAWKRKRSMQVADADVKPMNLVSLHVTTSETESDVQQQPQQRQQPDFHLDVESTESGDVSAATTEKLTRP